jgi:hypothetical protein
MSQPSSPEKMSPDLNGEHNKNATTVPVIGEGGGDNNVPREECQVYKFRWVVLILFVMYSMSNAFQWIQFAIINGLVAQFYGVSDNMVDMTSMIYMITYIPLIFPAMYFLDKYVSTFTFLSNFNPNKIHCLLFK